MKITNCIFRDYHNCKYKALLKIQQKKGEKMDYEKMQIELVSHNKHLFVKKTKQEYEKQDVLHVAAATKEDLECAKRIILDCEIVEGNMCAHFDGLEKVDGDSILGGFQYQPILVSESETVCKNDKLLLAFLGYVLSQVQGTRPIYGKIITGHNQHIRRVKLSTLYRAVEVAVEEIQKMIEMKAIPSLLLNSHCKVCEYKNTCEKEALETDNLSLLSTMSAKEIEKKHKKGIFTVTQLSHTFRPRRRKVKRVHLPELKALAIREGKIHVLEKPELPNAETRLYLDAEGDPDSGMDYLIGILSVNNNKESFTYFWSGSPIEQKQMYQQCIEYLQKFENYRLYHYGSYETKLLKRMQDILGTEWEQAIDDIAEHATNVLSLVYANIYFPTYSNSLKEIGSYLGCSWSGEQISGIQALYWCKQWNRTRSNKWKQKLTEYNKQDCIALRKVTECIGAIMEREGAQSLDDQKELVWTKDLKDQRLHGFRRNEFCFDEMEYVNKCAYSDYQRDKIYMRTNPVLKRKSSKRISRKRVIKEPNKIIKFPRPFRCTRCNSGKIRSEQIHSKRQMDLVFFQYGIKKWFIEYHAKRYRCKQCKKYFFNKDYEFLRGRYGWNLTCWVMFQKIACRQSWEQLDRSLNNFFGLSMNKTTLHKFLDDTASYYENTYKSIIKNLISGDLMHIDETRGSVRKENGYVWTFTNMEEVYFLYKNSREGEFLKDLLTDFSGVLVSDFYSAYDSIECKHQRCLVHLLRDLNDDLLKNPFDEDYKCLVRQFSTMLRSIVGTIDRFGLKRRHLVKHQKDVAKFYKYLEKYECDSDLFLKYRKKMNRNKDRLFTFLDHDGVPWNNNNAESAIKSFVLFRRESKGLFSPRTIDAYLILFSIYQTCTFKGVDFLQFLLSKEISIDGYIEKYGFHRKMNYEHKFETLHRKAKLQKRNRY